MLNGQVQGTGFIKNEIDEIYNHAGLHFNVMARFYRRRKRFVVRWRAFSNSVYNGLSYGCLNQCLLVHTKELSLSGRRDLRGTGGNGLDFFTIPCVEENGTMILHCRDGLELVRWFGEASDADRRRVR